MKGEIEKKIYKRVKYKKGNQKNKYQIEKHNISQIRIEELNWKETKLLLKSQWQK